MRRGPRRRCRRPQQEGAGPVGLQVGVPSLRRESVRIGESRDRDDEDRLALAVVEARGDDAVLVDADAGEVAEAQPVLVDARHREGTTELTEAVGLSIAADVEGERLSW